MLISNEQKILMSHAADLAKRAVARGVSVFTQFLSPADAELVSAQKYHAVIGSFGGYESAERRVISFSPTGNSAPDYPISVIKIIAKDKSVFSHRDYLGAVLSLGLKRETIGDISIFEDYALMFCMKNVADFVILNLNKIANANVSCTLYNENIEINDEKRFIDMSDTVSSMRLDCIVGAFANCSRTVAAEYIKSGAVSLNYAVCDDVSKIVKNNDVVSIRKVGKARIESGGELTKKGRIKINVKKYI